MKKVYFKPSVSIVNVRLFSSVLNDPDVGLGRNSVTVEDGFAKENDDVVVDDDDDMPMHTTWDTED